MIHVIAETISGAVDKDRALAQSCTVDNTKLLVAVVVVDTKLVVVDTIR